MDNITFPLNSESDGFCRTIKAQYAQTSYANFVRGDSFGASGSIRIRTMRSGCNIELGESTRTDQKSLLSESALSYLVNVCGGGQKLR